MGYIVIDIKDYIDWWFDIVFVQDLYLNNIEGHLLKIDCEQLVCTMFYFALIYSSSGCVLGSWTIFLFKGFNHVIHMCINLWSCCVRGCLRCLTCVGIPYFFIQFLYMFVNVFKQPLHYNSFSFFFKSML